MIGNSDNVESGQSYWTLISETFGMEDSVVMEIKNRQHKRWAGQNNDGIRNISCKMQMDPATVTNLLS